jgi:hypothetical protein
MVKEENISYHIVNKFVVAFLNSSELSSPELIDEWKSKSNLLKLKNTVRKSDKPSHPIRPKSEYIYFCEYTRPIIQAEMRRKYDEEGEFEKKVDIHKVTCELGIRWKQFKYTPDPEIKDLIAKNAEIDKKRYHTEKDAMQDKPIKNYNHLTSKYLYFCKELRDLNPKISLVTLAKLWSNQKDDDKLTKRYEAAKKDFQKESQKQQ